MARRIAIVNEKGGVGKTTTAVNLAVALAQRKKRVLLIDNDPQGNTTQFLGFVQLVDDSNTSGTASFTFNKAPFTPCRNVLVEGLDLLPADPELAFLEPALLDMVNGGPRRLATAISAIEAGYDFIIADCGPTVGMVATNAIVACPEILIPIKLAPASVPGALRLRKHLDNLRAAQEPAIRIMGILGTFYSESAKSPKEILELLRNAFGPLVFETVVHTSQAVETAAGLGRPIAALAPSERGAVEYNRLAEEVIARG